MANKVSLLDAFSRRVIAPPLGECSIRLPGSGAMGSRQRTELVLDAMNMAVAQRRPDNVIHHSDQGSQYTSVAFGLRCKEMGVRPSMGSVGDCCNNAFAIVARTKGATWLIARASSQRSNASCWNGEGSRPRPRLASRASSSSKDGATRPEGIPHWATNHPSTSKGPPLKRRNLQVHSRSRNRGNSRLVRLPALVDASAPFAKQ